MAGRTLSVRPKKKTFRNAGELPARFDTSDPRRPNFAAGRVEIDLRECAFIRPAAALWIVTYLALCRTHQTPCRLLVPSNMSACVYLKSVGVFQVLKDLGVEVDDRGIGGSPGSNVVLPVTPFRTIAEVTELTNQAFEKLQAGHRTPAGLAPAVTELWSELAMNAAEHSGSSVGAFGCIQFVEFKRGRRFSCVVADGGIGVRESLCKNPALKERVSYDWDALELAVRERVSGTGDPHRGIGLYGVSEDLRKPDHSLLLHSGMGSLEIQESVESLARRTRLFPGTLAHMAIPA